MEIDSQDSSAAKGGVKIQRGPAWLIFVHILPCWTTLL